MSVTVGVDMPFARRMPVITFIVTMRMGVLLVGMPMPMLVLMRMARRTLGRTSRRSDFDGFLAEGLGGGKYRTRQKGQPQH
jgi:hypothetical protein